MAYVESIYLRYQEWIVRQFWHDLWENKYGFFKSLKCEPNRPFIWVKPLISFINKLQDAKLKRFGQKHSSFFIFWVF